MYARPIRWLIAACCLVVAAMSLVARAANVTWNGATSTEFSLGSNWAGGSAPTNNLTTDVGVFAGTVAANQPSLTASGSITGLSFTTTTGGWALSSSTSANVLSLGASGVSSTNTSGTNTISANLAIGATQTWQAGTGGTLRITGGVTAGSSGSPSASGFTIGAGSNNGTVVFDPAAGNNMAIYYQGTPSGTAGSALNIAKATVFGSAVNSTSGTNVISHATSGGITVAAGGSLTVNSGVWQTSDISRNSGSAMAGDVNVFAGTLAGGGGRYMLSFNGTAAGQATVDGGTLKISGSSNLSNGASFQLGSAFTGTPLATTVANFNLRSGLVDVAKGVGSNNQVGSGIGTNAPSVLMNQSGGVAQFGVTVGSNVFTGATNANTLANLYIGSVGVSGTGIKAAYTLAGGRLLVAGNLQGNAPAAGSNGVSNFNFTGGTLTVGTIDATNLGSSSTATSITNQVSASTNVGTLVNYGGILAPGCDLLSITSDQYGNSSIATAAVAGRTTITGNYVVSSSSAALAVNLAGTTASTTFQEAVNSTRFSNVTISGIGTNTLGGNLLVNLIPGSGGTTFAPTNANTFKVVSFTGSGATNSGTFAGNNVAGNKAIATDGLTAFTLTYDYTAATGGVTLGSGTTNEWNAAASGGNWNTAGNWTSLAANTSAFIARFADSAAVPTGANSVDLANNLTIQGIQLSSTSRQYSITSGNGSGLTLDASPRNTTNLMTNAPVAATAQIADSSSGAGSHTIGVPLALASDLAVSVNNAASTVTIGGNVSGAGRSLAKSGSGTLVLSGSNSYTGSTTVTGGTLSAPSPNALPGWNSTGKVTVGTGAGLTITTAFSAGDLTTLLANVTFSGSNRLGIDTTSGNLAYASAITDKGTGGFGLIKLGSGTLTLSGSNSYTGGTGIGTTSSATSAVIVQGNQSAATGGWSIGTLNTGRNLVTFDAGSTVAVAAGREIQVGAKSTFLGSTPTAQILTASGSVANAGSLHVGRGGQVNLQTGAAWTQSGSATVEALGGSSVSLNVNTGASYAYTGTSTFRVNGALNSSGIATVAIAGGTLTTARGFEQASVSGTSTGYGRVSLSSGGVLRITDTIPVLSSGSIAPVRFELGSGGGRIDTNGFDATLAVGITGSGGLTKAGVGRLTLTGTSTYSGATAVDAGTLAVAGQLGPGTLTVSLGAILEGSGVIAGSTVINGTYSPGSSPGLPTNTAGLTFNAPSTAVWELWANTDAPSARGVSYDGINLTGGALTVVTGALLQLDFGTSPTSTVDWDDAFWDASHTWTFIDVSGTGSWNQSLFTSLLVGTDATGASLDSKRAGASFGIASQDGDLVIEYVVVPEPAALALAAGGIGIVSAAFLRRPRRRKVSSHGAS